MKSFTYREIKDQYNRLKQTKEYMNENIDRVVPLYASHPVVIYIGCGSSYSLAKSMAAATMIHLNEKSFAIPAGDIMLRPYAYRGVFEGALVVALSRSGSTSEILLACDRMRKSGARYTLLSVSCRTDKELAHMSDFALELPWAFDQSVCQTSTVTNLYFTVMYLIAELSRNTALVSGLYEMIEKGDDFITENEASLADIARMDWSQGICLGDAELCGICEEGALAFKEICQLPSNFYNLLDSRHGPMAIIGGPHLVIAAVSDVSNHYEIDLIKEIQEKGSTVVTVSDSPFEMDGVINFCLGKKAPYPVLGIPFINVAQMITCYKAEERGVNPDKPNGLDPWITL